MGGLNYMYDFHSFLQVVSIENYVIVPKVNFPTQYWGLIEPCFEKG